MKKLFLLIGIMFVCGTAHAEFSVIDNLKKLPEMKQGVALSVMDNRWNYLSTIKVAEWKNINFEIGYAGVAKETGDKVVAVVSYPIFKMKNYLSVPIIDLIDVNVGGYVGYGRVTGSDEFDVGVSATAINIKF